MTSKRIKHLKDLMIRARANAFDDLANVLGQEIRGDLADNQPARRPTRSLVEHIVNAHNRMEKIDAALSRMETGQYGLCLDCERLIEEDRLLAQPWAEACASCERQHQAEMLEHLPLEFKMIAGRPVEAAWQA